MNSNPQTEAEIEAKIAEKKAELEFLNKALRALREVEEDDDREDDDGKITKLEEEITAA
ncbi:MAG: hypothetical protein PHO48_03095 [Candidatus Gracilibacteria bacterium]|jgi:hypothetical protein|nr:hypothetical protein [Candidatus Gracilibacteria bacterium]MDD5179296.1 hypothetical protein [Candidatus Gracilibacteria bacterium]